MDIYVAYRAVARSAPSNPNSDYVADVEVIGLYRSANEANGACDKLIANAAADNDETAYEYTVELRGIQ